MPQAVIPSFSPELLLRPVMRLLPDMIVRSAITQRLCGFHRDYPGIAARLSDIQGAVFEINVIEFPYPIYLGIGSGGEIQIRYGAHEDKPDVRVSGTLHGFVRMLDGTDDGDALFFSRSLRIEGDTEALLTLRNAMDSENVDFLRLLVPSPLHAAAKRLSAPLRSLIKAAQEDLDVIADSIRGSVERRCQALEVRQQENSQKIQQVELSLDKQNRRIQNLTGKVRNERA